MAYLQVEVKKNDHFLVTWLKYCMSNIVVQNIHFVSPNTGVPKPVRVSLWAERDVNYAK